MAVARKRYAKLIARFLHRRKTCCAGKRVAASEKLAALEAALVGVPETEAEVAIARFYKEHGIESPGVTPADFGRVLA